MAKLFTGVGELLRGAKTCYECETETTQASHWWKKSRSSRIAPPNLGSTS